MNVIVTNIVGSQVGILSRIRVTRSQTVIGKFNGRHFNFLAGECTIRLCQWVSLPGRRGTDWLMDEGVGEYAGKEVDEGFGKGSVSGPGCN